MHFTKINVETVKDNSNLSAFEWLESLGYISSLTLEATENPRDSLDEKVLGTLPIIIGTKLVVLNALENDEVSKNIKKTIGPVLYTAVAAAFNLLTYHGKNTNECVV